MERLRNGQACPVKVFSDIDWSVKWVICNLDMHEFDRPAVIRSRVALEPYKLAVLKCAKLLFCGSDITLSLSRLL
jgi:hypothetical protein